MKQFTLVLMLVLFAVGYGLAQRTISGSIMDDEGEVLIGASILVKGTGSGTVTDIDGKYTIDVPEGSTLLVVSYTGYATQEIEIGASNILDVTLSGSSTILGEIVVTAVGLEVNRAKLGYSIQNVSPDEIIGSRETNLVDALNSKVAGVQVTSSSGSPGASSSIRIRGSVSVNKSNQPLFVVDGVPIDNSTFGNGTGGVDNSNRVIDINPNDIAAMSVLKGPSATALYGVRAANGAIVITTKKGKAGKPVVNISASYGADKVNKFPDLQNTYSQGRYLSGVPTYLGPEGGNGFSWGPLIADLEYDGNTDYFFNRKGALVPNGAGNGQPAEAFDQKDFFVTGQTYDLNVNVSGGTDAIKYYISGGRLSSTGIVPNADFKRTSFRVNTDAQLSDKLSAGISLNYVNSGGTRIQRGSNLNGVMLGLLRTAPTFDNGNGKTGQAAADDPDTYLNPDGSQRSYRWGIYDSPYWTVNKNPSEDEVNRVIGNVNLKYDIADWLFLSYRFGADTYTDRRISSFDINLGGFGSNSGSVTNRNINVIDLNSDLLLGYNKSLSETLSLSGVVGYNVYNTHTVDRTTAGTTLAAPNFYHISNATDLTSSEGIFRKRIHGAYATADVNFSEYLFLNLAFRNDWSSSLPTDNNTYQSFSVSLGLELVEALKIDQ
ncbi:MAG: TonB-linked SusC/RagA family outer membrane protein, partial [Saprospiraceae bacterium]